MTDRPQTDPAVRQRLRDAFASDDLILRAALEKARSAFNHPGVKGDVVERATRSFLRTHLPRKFDVGTGEVIDRFGNRSPQLDIIVLNDDQPFTYGLDTDGMYLAEGVAAIGEIKSHMGTSELADILAKGEKIRKLRPEPLEGDQIRGNMSDISRFVMSFPYFAVALESSMATETIMDTLIASEEVEAPDGSGLRLSKLDALFVLDKGVFQHFGDGQGSLKFLSPDAVSMPGWGGTRNDGALVSLFTWLNGVIPRVQRSSSIAVPYLIDSGPVPTRGGS
jgi:hypothetical protein